MQAHLYTHITYDQQMSQFVNAHGFASVYIVYLDAFTAPANPHRKTVSESFIAASITQLWCFIALLGLATSKG